MRPRPTLALVLLAACASGAGATTPRAATVLGHAPLCEASGALVVPCAAAGGRCLLVADNERATELYLFDVEGARLRNQRPVALRTADGGEAAVKDAEGLALLGERVVVLGSHSRRSWTNAKPCSLDPARLALGVFARAGDARLVGQRRSTAAGAWTELLGREACATRLIRSGGPLAARVCDAIADGQAHATESAEACARGVNFEGVAVLGTSLWLGLRGPTVDQEAVLLRLAGAGELRFDGVAMLDLGGDGVRDLATDGASLWILAGPSADLMHPGSLWRLPLGAVADGARLEPTRVVAALPPFAEAIALEPGGRGAFVLVDGDGAEGAGDANGCPTPARYLYLDLDERARDARERDPPPAE